MPRQPSPAAVAARRVIHAVLMERGPSTFYAISVIAGSHGHDAKLVSNSLQLMKSMGLTDYSKRSAHWSLTEAGKRAIL